MGASNLVSWATLRLRTLLLWQWLCICDEVKGKGNVLAALQRNVCGSLVLHHGSGMHGPHGRAVCGQNGLGPAPSPHRTPSILDFHLLGSGILCSHVRHAASACLPGAPSLPTFAFVNFYERILWWSLIKYALRSANLQAPICDHLQISQSDVLLPLT